MGEDCYFVPDAVIEHAGSGTTGRHSAFTTYHGTRNRIWTYVKNMPLGLMVLTLPGHIALSAYVLARNSFTPRFGPMLRGTWDGICGAARMRTAPNWRVKRRGRLVRSMAWNPWRMSQRRAHVRPAT